MNFYVYTYFDPSRNEPFYVGKGTGRRAWCHLGRKDMHPFTHRLQKMQREGVEPIIKFIGGLDEELALLVEAELIALYGRKDLGKGPLLNLTDGGSSGPTGFKQSDETKAKISAKLKAKPNKPWEGKHLSIEHRQKIAGAGKKRIVSDETKAKIAASRTGKKYPRR